MLRDGLHPRPTTLWAEELLTGSLRPTYPVGQAYLLPTVLGSVVLMVIERIKLMNEVLRTVPNTR